MADETDALARPEAETEVLENVLPVGIVEIDVLELHTGAAPDQRLRFGMVAQLMGQQQRRHRLRKTGDMLRDVDERHREIARRMQHGQPKRAHEHDIARRRRALLPEHDYPSEQTE